ncbi:hypothetical protein BDZ45DRAFT_678961 [Acephala macrosclerotiorum]|nr:hypothetical protein BDZ45DRAFT_678961 [Acephala macrosclerotiorum]
MFRSLLAVGFLVRLCAAQQSGWQANQVNATMCYWDSPRAAVVRDTLYIDGGALWWTPGMADGSYGPPTSDDNPLGIVYLLNFNTSFNATASTNFSKTVFTTQSKSNGAANNVAPNYYDGAMLANDFEWFIYGGLITQTAEYTPPAGDIAAVYEVYASGPPKQFHAGYIVDTLSDGVTRYVTNGAAVSVPSENLGFYFGGLRSASHGEIYYQTSNESQNADVLSTTMIELNMTVQTEETWKNLTLPTTVPGRINAELVWVPVSKQGVLVAIGGVIDIQFESLTTSLNLTEQTQTNATSPKFMSTVSVYDIADGIWYEQPTSETPPPMLTQGCTVMASAQDGSSHNIYWYGGWDGIDSTGSSFNDDVWVLSIPAFMWTKVASGSIAGHARAGHRCTKPYPDTMFVVGGYSQLSGTTPQCLKDLNGQDGGFIQIFNLSTATWINSYDPNVWSNYTVPSTILSMIGGTGTGSATQTTPSPSGFANSSMTSLFGTPYNTSKITTWYPYQATSPSATPTNSSTPSVSPVPKGSSTPSYLGPVLGVVLGLFFLTLAIVAFLLWRRRGLFKSSTAGGQSENGTMDNRRWVTNWLRGTPADAKAPTVTTDETPISPYDQEERVEMPMAEVQGRQVYEMMDTSLLNELHAHPAPDTGTGLHPIPMAIVPNSPASRTRGLAPSTSVTSATSNASSVSHVSDPSNPSPQRPPVSPVLSSSPDGGAVNRDRFVSGVSNVSESDRGHLRGISETSVSTEDGGMPFVTPMEAPGASRGLEIGNVPPAVPDPPIRTSAVSPLTPPQGVGREGGDYLGAKDGSGGKESPITKRKSNFSEELGEDDASSSGQK